MPPRNILLKPASGDCNLRCRYCFYHDEAANRACRSYGRMTLETLEAVISKSMAAAEGQCTFGFQGGEPTLAGLDFFRHVVALEQAYSRPGLRVYNALQTNGTLLDESWAAFLQENSFLVGVSLDGHQSLHDLYRKDAAGNGTFDRVMEGLRLLKAHQVPVNILTVVTAQTARNAREMSSFFRHMGFSYQQHIPCLDPLGLPRGRQPYSLTPERYARFLISTFDFWFRERTEGRFLYNRYFDNLLGICLGRQPEACGMLGQCGIQYAVEADGSVYPCDFYMLDGYRLGNFRDNTVEELDQAREALGFVEQSRAIAPACRRCRWFPLCRGGCRRDRPETAAGELLENVYCPAYQTFFAHAAPRLEALVRAMTGN